MPHATTIAIAWCIFGFASSDMGEELARNIQTTPVQDYTLKVKRNPRDTVTCDKRHDVQENKVGLQRFDRAATKSALLTQLQADERFWSTYRDFDPDADSIRAWKEFQTDLAGQN